ncbi:MAG: transposase [Rhodospirillaceae bacterium]|nr:transposase [Magnetovibrio sp.]MAY68567.1 transposase [Rhodospirillaceae bacterium]
MPATIDYKIGGVFSLNGREATITSIIDVDRVLLQLNESGEIVTAATSELRVPPDSEPPKTRAFDGLTEGELSEARRRYAAIEPLLAVTRGKTEACKKRAEETGYGARSLQRWLRAYTNRRLLSDLAPDRGGKRKSRLHKKVEAIIKDFINRRYLTKQKLTQKKVIAEIRQACKAARLKPPSANTIRSRIKDMSAALVTKRRHGAKKARDDHAYVKGRFPGAVRPLSVVQIDHTKLDIEIVDDVYRQPIGRPWITLAIDVYSRMITGMYLSLEAPSAFSVGMCIRNSVLRKETDLGRLGIDAEWPVWGLMDKLHFDNGKDFHSETVLKGCEEYGIDVDYRLVKRPEFGGHIERAIGTIGRKTHELPGTTFSNIVMKGVYDSEKNAAITFSKLEKILTEYIVSVYHQTHHSGIDMSPLQKWREGIVGVLGSTKKLGRGMIPEIADPDRFSIDFLPHDTRSVRSEGIVWDRIWYFDECLKDWVNAKKGGQTQEFLVRRDPRDISKIYFFDPELKTYFEVPYRYNDHPSISLWELKAVKKRLQDEKAAERDEDAIFATLEKIEIEIEEEVRVTKKTRRQAQRRKTITESSPEQPRERPKLVVDNSSGTGEKFELTDDVLTPRWRE